MGWWWTKSRWHQEVAVREEEGPEVVAELGPSRVISRLFCFRLPPPPPPLRLSILSLHFHAFHSLHFISSPTSSNGPGMAYTINMTSVLCQDSTHHYGNGSGTVNFKGLIIPYSAELSGHVRLEELSLISLGERRPRGHCLGLELFSRAFPTTSVLLLRQHGTFLPL